MAEVRLSRRAVKDLDRLPSRTVRRILDALDALAEDPRSSEFDVKLLVGRRPWRRLRIGDFRVLFRLSEAGMIVLVARVVDRKELEQAVLALPD